MTFGGLVSSQAQTTIPNGDFENWTDVGLVTERPTNWNSNKNGGGYANVPGQTCFRDSNAHSGTYCLMVQTETVFGTTVVNGSCATGLIEAPTFTKTDGYIADTGVIRNPFVGRPDSIVFWYKYTQVDSDYPSVQVRLHVGDAYTPEAPSNSNHPDSTANIIARALWTGPGANQATWMRISVPMTYVDSRTPQYILISTTSSANQSAGAAGSTLWLDDMQAIYNGTNGIQNVAAENVKVYSSNDRITADLRGSDMLNPSIQIIDMNGRMVMERQLAANGVTTLDMPVTAGVYIYRVSSGQSAATGKIVKQ